MFLSFAPLLALMACADPRPSILLVTLDTTRADRLGPYGYMLAQTPTLDALAAQGVVYTRAYATCPLTIPSHASLFTGRTPPSHGVRDNGDYVLPETAITLAERFAEAGWRTAAFTAAFPTQARWGLNQGFERYHDPLRRLPTQLDWSDQRAADEVITDALATLPGLAKDGEPLFVWVHLFDAHWPYEPPEPALSAHPGRPYDGEITFADAELGRLIAWFDEARPGGVVVITADHGEGLGDGGERTHGFLLHDGTVRVPLIVRAPGLTALGRVDDPVSHLDVAPTLLNLAGLPLHDEPGVLREPDGGADPRSRARTDAAHHAVQARQRRTSSPRQDGHPAHRAGAGQGHQQNRQLRLSMATSIRITALEGVPEIAPGQALDEVLAAALQQNGLSLADGDAVVCCQKIVSKSENRFVELATVTPSARAQELSAICGKDPRLVELVLGESTEVVRCIKDVLIVRHKLGFVVANAAIDQSNIPGGGERALLLPVDPDASAARLRDAIARRLGVKVGVLISDSFGRPWRIGVSGVGIGCAGLRAVIDERGRTDRFGRELQVTQIAVADQLAAAAVMAMGEADEGRPMVVVSGLPTRYFNIHTPASALVRPLNEDLFK